MALRKDYPNIIEAINDIADEINCILNDRQRDKYFDSIVLLYSFVENLLKLIVFFKLLWNKSRRVLRAEEVNAVRGYCKGLSFYHAQQTAFSLDVVDWKLYTRIDAVRKERNDIIHHFWLYAHRGNRWVLRKKLEKLARVTSDLVRSFNKLAQEIGLVDMIDGFVCL